MNSLHESPKIVKTPKPKLIRLATCHLFTGKLPPTSPLWREVSFNKDSWPIRSMTVQEIADHLQAGYPITAARLGSRRSGRLAQLALLGLDYDKLQPGVTLADLAQLHPEAAVIYSTASHLPEAPRYRVLFVLDAPLASEDEANAYINAWLGVHPYADQSTRDAQRIWFGSTGCEIYVNPDAVLPLAEVERARRHLRNRQAQGTEATGPVVLTNDPAQLLDFALRYADDGRNTAGAWLAKHLRFAGLPNDEAQEWMSLYQQSVQDHGNHSYTSAEATATLKSVYRKGELSEPQEAGKVAGIIEAAKAAATELPIKKPLLKSLLAVLEIMRAANKVDDVGIPARRLQGAIGAASPDTSTKHLNQLCELGILRKEMTHKIRGNRYSLGASLYETCAAIVHVFKAEGDPTGQSPTLNNMYDLCTYSPGILGDLLAFPSCQRGAYVLPERIPATHRNPEALTTGGQAIAYLLATLEAQGTLATGELMTLARVSRRTGADVLNTLEALGIVHRERTGRQVYVSLDDNWYELLAQAQPMFSAYGVQALRDKKIATQREAWHQPRAMAGRLPDVATAFAHAGADLLEADEKLAQANAKLAQYAQATDTTLTTVATRRRATEPVHVEPVAAKKLRERTGRTLEPSKAITGPNAPMPGDHVNLDPVERVIGYDVLIGTRSFRAHEGQVTDWQPWIDYGETLVAAKKEGDTDAKLLIDWLKHPIAPDPAHLLAAATKFSAALASSIVPTRAQAQAIAA